MFSNTSIFLTHKTLFLAHRKDIINLRKKCSYFKKQPGILSKELIFPIPLQRCQVFYCLIPFQYQV